jgi:ADP-ribose pyrophosphatase YjhB (NUDIX family)
LKQAAVVEYDEDGNLTKYSHDIVLWNDGAVDPRTETSSPGAVVVPIEKVGENYYVHCFWQWRFAPWDDEIQVPDDLTAEQAKDFVALNRGEWFLTTPGGFASFAGEKPETVAKREAMEEAGLKVLKPVFDRKSFNRANVSTLVRVGYSVFERTGTEQLVDEAEKILGKMAVRIDKFRTTDAHVGEAIQFAREDLGLISASPLNK